MENRDPSVSVIIPAFNSAGTIRRALDSVLTQTRPPEQIIVVDDGSADGTAVIVSEYGGRINYFWQPNSGPGAARNRGIQEATESWIAFLDADDEWLPDRLESQLRILQAHPDLVWITGNFLRRDWQGQSAPGFASSGKTIRPDRMSFFAAFVRRCWGCTDTMLIRRDLFARVGVFAAKYAITEDLDMWFRIAFECLEIGIVSEPLAVYHLDTPDSLIKSRRQDVDVLIEFLRRNLRLAQDRGRTAEFRPCASLLLRTWIRGMLFAGLGPQTRRLAGEFGSYLPRHFLIFAWMGSLCPGLTAVGLRFISRLARIVGLRREPTRKPSCS